MKQDTSGTLAPAGEGATDLIGLNIPQTKIKVAYDCVKVNTDKRLFEGKVASTYQRDWKNIKDSEYVAISDSISPISGTGTKTNPIKIDDTIIEDVKINDDGEIIIVKEDGTETTITDLLEDGNELVNTLAGSSSVTSYLEGIDKNGNATVYEINKSSNLSSINI